ncbi:hypothetical protein BJ170DRAFT_695541 [Xylariales sp. AK1849]|nr:hypothetical protein BJ170DRAFT_695541 [Xylariales sp. AK1849]
MSSPSYHARRYRTLFSPDALNFSSRQPRAAVAAVYSPAPTGIYCGLPRASRLKGGPKILPLLIPIIAATAAVTYLEAQLDNRGIGNGVEGMMQVQ